MENEQNKKGRKYLIAYGAIFGGLLLFIVMLSMDSPKVPNIISVASSPPSYSATGSPNSQSSANIKVSTSIEQRGEYLVITTTTKNDKDFPVKQNLEVSVVDSTGQKHFIDKIYVELGAGESGKAESTAKVGNLGPPPYKVVTNWQ